MNAVDPALARLSTSRRRAPKPRREDREFLPADLEILETPPSPVRLALILAIAGFTLAALAWSWFGHVEIIAQAQGKIQPTGRVKVLQPLETGKVARLHAENGRKVEAGEVLLDMESGEAEAEARATEADLLATRAEALRRRAALTAAARAPIPLTVPIDWPADIPAANRAREEQVLAADLGQLATTLASLEAQLAQKAVERDRLAETIGAQEALLRTLNERVGMRAALVESAAGSRATVIDAVESLQIQETTLTTQRSQFASTVAGITVLERERERQLSGFRADNEQRLADAARRADGLEQTLAKDRLRLDHLSLRSPIAGTVTGLTVTTLGQVVTTGEEVMRIVPEGAGLEIEAYLPNRDVGFVRAGQSVMVKVESFPFTRYGTLKGEVVRVGRDALPEADARSLESLGTQGAKPALFASAERLQNLVYPVTIALREASLTVDGTPVPMTPGMAVTAEIATGERRILDYFLDPLLETGSEAMRER